MFIVVESFMRKYKQEPVTFSIYWSVFQFFKRQ